METHILETVIQKKGYLVLRNLPFDEGTPVEIAISKRETQKNLQKLIDNDHIWTSEDIRAVESGRDIINKWQTS